MCETYHLLSLSKLHKHTGARKHVIKQNADGSRWVSCIKGIFMQAILHS